MKKTTFITSLAVTTMIIISFVCFANKKINNTMIDRTDIYKIIHYASLAGSSHNTQPWRVEVFPNDSITIFVDTSRLLKVVDPRGIELFISVGAFIENLSIAANTLGYITEITINETNINSNSPVSIIKLSKISSVQNLEVLKELELRTTLRIPFETVAIKTVDLEKIVSIAPDNISFIPSSSPNGAFIAKKELEAYTIQAYNKDAQDELAAWMRFSNKDINSKRDGLTPAGMGIKGIAGFFVRNFMKPDDSKKESFVKKGVEKTQKQVENCAGWIIISTEEDNTKNLINIGRIYERINIECRSLNIGFHPMNQIIEEYPVYKEVKDKLKLGKEIRFIARIGYVDKYPAPVSKRRSVESFTVFK